ncbi:MAG: hypothetical protein WA718_12375 [Terriglobales bacterium]
MKHICHELFVSSTRRRQLAVTELLRRARIVTDPKKLADLNAQAEKLKCEPGTGRFRLRVDRLGLN